MNYLTIIRAFVVYIIRTFAAQIKLTRTPMSYSGRRRYKSRRERYQRTTRNLRIFFIFAAIALVVLLFKNRIYIYDYIRTLLY